MSDERYLPGPAAPTRGGTTLMIVAVVAIALLASATLTISGAGFELMTMATVAAIWGFVLFGGVMVWFLWTAHRFYAATDAALVALGRGELERAAEVWSAWEATRAPEMVRAQAAHNLGWTVIRQGQPRRAIQILGSNDRRRRAGLTSASLAATTAQDLSLCHSLIGELEAAEAWFDESERRRRTKAPATFGAMRAFTRAVLDCRAGRAKDAARELRDGWAEIESTAPTELLRPMRVVRAFATAGGAAKKAGDLGSLRPAYAREFDFLGVEWPEMAAFLAAHDLATKT
jgi:hypothetical protein